MKETLIIYAGVTALLVGAVFLDVQLNVMAEARRPPTEITCRVALVDFEKKVERYLNND